MATMNRYSSALLVVAASIALAVAGCGRDSAYSPSFVEVDDLRNQFRAEQNGPIPEPPPAQEFQHDGGYVTLRGRFVLDGEAPPRASLLAAIRANRDSALCAPGDRDLLSEHLIVHPSTKAIRNVVVYLEVEPARKIPLHESALAPSGERPLLDQKDCVFTPHVMVAHMGHQTLTLRNSDRTLHNTAFDIRGARADVRLGPLESSTYAMAVETQVPVAVGCNYHGWMRAYFMPRSNGYFAVTDENGEFEIKNLPSGDVLTFNVWHEAAGGRSGRRFAASAPGTQPHRDGFKITLAADSAVQELEFKLPARTIGGR